MPKSYTDFQINLPHNPRGVEVYTTCPQCSPQRKKKNIKCLSVNLEKECWVCHHCGWVGTLKSGSSHQQKYKHWQQPDYQPPNTLAPDTPPPQVLQWFANRGISPDTLAKNKIRYGKIYMPQAEGTVDAIQFPYYDTDNTLVNIKYRDDKKNFRLSVGAKRIAYGLYDINTDLVIIVEGEIDKLSLYEAGIKSCISVPDGAPPPHAKNYQSKFDWLDNCHDQLDPVEYFVIAVDNDEPGQTLEVELIRRLGRHRCGVVRWPKDCKDANDTLIKYGKEKILECIYSADLLPVDGVVHVHDLQDTTLLLYNQGRRPGLELQWNNLHHLYRIAPGEWTIITGIPGHGKSEFLDAVMINLAQTYSWRFAVYSPENSPPEEHLAKLSEKITGKPFGQLQHFTRMQPQELFEALSFLDTHLYFIESGDENLKLQTILDTTSKLIARYGINGLIIDPWNQLDHTREHTFSETEYISQTLSLLTRFVKHHQIHAWIVAHPAKLTKDKDGKYPVPSPYDIAGSAHWINKCYNCITVHRTDRKDDTLPTQIHVQKIKHKKNGHVGLAKLTYDKLSGRYYDYKEITGPLPVLPTPGPLFQAGP